MKSGILFLPAILASLAPIPEAIAKEGGVGSHGATALVCADRVRLLDLYEAEAVPALAQILRIVYSGDSVGAQVERAIAEIGLVSADSAERVRAVVANFRAKVVPDLSGADGTTVDFELAPPPPSGCRYANVVHYDHDDRIRLNPTLYARLSRTDRAALEIHEALYRLFRGANPDTPRSTWAIRRMTALLFANGNYPGFLRELISFHLVSEGERGLALDIGASESREGCVADVVWTDVRDARGTVAVPRLLHGGREVPEGPEGFALPRVNYQDLGYVLELRHRGLAPPEGARVHLRLRCRDEGPFDIAFAAGELQVERGREWVMRIPVRFVRLKLAQRYLGLR